MPPAGDSSTPTMPKDNDLSSKYLESSEYQAVTTMLEPIIDGVEVHNGNHTMNCVTDSYATNILWQVHKNMYIALYLHVAMASLQ